MTQIKNKKSSTSANGGVACSDITIINSGQNIKKKINENIGEQTQTSRNWREEDTWKKRKALSVFPLGASGYLKFKEETANVLVEESEDRLGDHSS